MHLLQRAAPAFFPHRRRLDAPFLRLLPRSAPPTPEPASRDGETRTSTPHQMEILAVDDQPVNLDLLEALLVGMSVKVVRARSGEEALEIARNREFALVLMDIRMPGMDGIETAKRLRENLAHAHTPVIFVTAYTPQDQDMIRGYHAGGVDYLFKPLIPQVVRAKVEAFADLYQANRQLLRQAGVDAVNRTLRADLDALHAAKTELEQIAHFDGLTGLANRACFLKRLGQEIAGAKRHGSSLAVMFVDLDRFKEVNDTLGHDAGDDLLAQAAERLVGCIRAEDTVARLGGDEFVMLLSGIPGPAVAAAVAGKALEQLARPMVVAGKEIFVSASIGISLLPDNGLTSQTLLKNADMALYRAKHAGRNNYQFYTEDLTRAARQRMETERALRGAVARQEFELVFQPKLDLRRRTVESVEALLRWRQGGRLHLPDTFMMVSEETGLAEPIGAWVFEHACRQLQAWSDAGLPPLRVAVNLSAHQFQRPNFLAMVERVLKETGADPGQLELEITEHIACQDFQQTVRVLNRLREMGLRLAMDDFGIGYSSLNYLKHFPLDALKIDRSFVQGMTTCERDLAIVRTVIAIAHSLDMRAVAEGVETAEQLEMLQRLLCDKVQGHLVAPPLSPDNIGAFLEGLPALLAGLLPERQERAGIAGKM